MNVNNPELLEMLQNLDAALKMQAVIANPNQAFVGPSVAEMAATRIESLLMEIEELQKDAMELKMNEAEVQKLNLQPGEVLVVKIRSDQIDSDSMQALSNGLKKVFSNNKVVVLAVGEEGSIDLTAVAASEYPDEVKPKVDCSTVNYCDSCSCGKKEAYEGSQK